VSAVCGDWLFRSRRPPCDRTVPALHLISRTYLQIYAGLLLFLSPAKAVLRARSERVLGVSRGWQLSSLLALLLLGWLHLLAPLPQPLSLPTPCRTSTRCPSPPSLQTAPVGLGTGGSRRTFLCSGPTPLACCWASSTRCRPTPWRTARRGTARWPSCCSSPPCSWWWAAWAPWETWATADAKRCGASRQTVGTPCALGPVLLRGVCMLTPQ
jgi:hypothetical protein